VCLAKKTERGENACHEEDDSEATEVLSDGITGEDRGQGRSEEAGVEVSLQTRRNILQYLAPRYQQASSAERNTLVDEFTAITGYNRRYARWLLNHAEAVQQATACPKQRYGTEVQQALLLAWNAANRMCAKRLIPFLPTLIDAFYMQVRVVLLKVLDEVSDGLLRGQVCQQEINRGILAFRGDLAPSLFASGTVPADHHDGGTHPCQCQRGGLPDP